MVAIRSLDRGVRSVHPSWKQGLASGNSVSGTEAGLMQRIRDVPYLFVPTGPAGTTVDGVYISSGTDDTVCRRHSGVDGADGQAEGAWSRAVNEHR